MCATAAGERTWNVGPLPFVEASSVPSHRDTENGRSGSARSSSFTSGAVRANGTRRMVVEYY